VAGGAGGDTGTAAGSGTGGGEAMVVTGALQGWVSTLAGHSAWVCARTCAGMKVVVTRVRTYSTLFICSSIIDACRDLSRSAEACRHSHRHSFRQSYTHSHRHSYRNRHTGKCAPAGTAAGTVQLGGTCAPVAKGTRYNYPAYLHTLDCVHDHLHVVIQVSRYGRQTEPWAHNPHHNGTRRDVDYSRKPTLSTTGHITVMHYSQARTRHQHSIAAARRG
jgi:hypothetical protein